MTALVVIKNSFDRANIESSNCTKKNSQATKYVFLQTYESAQAKLNVFYCRVKKEDRRTLL